MYTLVNYEKGKEASRESFDSFDLAKEMAEKAISTSIADRSEVVDFEGKVRFQRPRTLRSA